MLENLNLSFKQLYTTENIQEYIHMLIESPMRIVLAAIDIILVIFLVVKLFDLLKDTRAWQLLRGVFVLIIATVLSRNLSI